MTVSPLHLRHQGPVLGSMARALLPVGVGKRARSPVLPGPVFEATVHSLPDALVRDYVRHVGGDPRNYLGTTPGHLFPQWGFPLLAKTLHASPYPLTRIVNAGCRLELRDPLPNDRAWVVRAQLVGVHDDGRRVRLHQRLTTGPRDCPEAIVAHVHAIVPSPHPTATEGERPSKPRPRIPDDAEELARLRIPKNAGLDFALLTGDFNPIHWVPMYARAMGLRGTILHGFSTLARTIEGLGRSLLSGSPRRIASIDAKFTRPLPLPARVGLYLDGPKVFVGDAPGGPCYLDARLELRP